MKRSVVATVNWLGDAILTTPVFKALKDTYPDSYIAVMAPQRVADVYRNNPNIDDIIIFDEKGKQRGFKEKLEFIRSLKEKKFDTVYLIHRSLTRALVCYFAGIKERIGYKRFKTWFILTKRIPAPYISVHRQEYYLNLFAQGGVEIKNTMPEFFIPEDIRSNIKKSLEKQKKLHKYLVGINPSANWELKRWPKEKFAQLADRLISELDCGLYFVGAKQDEKVIRSVIRLMHQAPYDLCGETSIKELAAYVESMDLFISNDSGPAHLAAALGTKTLALFGPTSTQVTSPKGKRVTLLQTNVGCKIPCYDLMCKENICMKRILVTEVFEKAKSLLLK